MEEIKTPYEPSTLDIMIAENFSMKEDIELKLGQIMDYKYMVEAYSEKIEEEMLKS